MTYQDILWRLCDEEFEYSRLWLEHLKLSTEQLYQLLEASRAYEEAIDELSEEFDNPENGHEYRRGADYELCLQQEFDIFQDNLESIDYRLCSDYEDE